MPELHRATPEQWANQNLWAQSDDDSACLIDLRARVEALEAAQLEQAESHRFCTDAIVRRVEALEATQHAHADLSHLSGAEQDRIAQELAKPAAWRPLETEITYGSEAAADAVQILRAPMVVQGTFEHGGETYQFKAKPERESAMTELRAASAEARPAASEIFPVEYADSNGEGIRIIMEPADETGRVCWVVRNSRRVNPIHEFPTPEAAYAAHQARAEDEADRG